MKHLILTRHLTLCPVTGKGILQKVTYKNAQQRRACSWVGCMVMTCAHFSIMPYFPAESHKNAAYIDYIHTQSVISHRYDFNYCYTRML